MLLPLQLNRYDRNESRGRVVQAIEQVGLGDRLDSYPDRLSGGEKQRVAIARALVHDPKIILADEPTGNLDADTGMAIMSLMGELARSSGKTMIVVSHSDTVIEMAERVLMVVDGQLMERAHTYA